MTTDMGFFPIFIDLKDAECLILGGGKVAYRKVCVLLEFGAKITIVADKLDKALKELSKNEPNIKIVNLNIKCDTFFKTMEMIKLQQYKLVIAATDDTMINHLAAQECSKFNIPVNAVDQIEDCSFIFPSYFRRGDLTVGVTSSGKSPYYASILRKQYESVTPEDTEEWLDKLGKIRIWLKENVADSRQRGGILKEIIDISISSGNLLSDRELEKLLLKRGLKHGKIS